MRFSPLLLLCLVSGLVQADWTGIELRLGDNDVDWRFGDVRREAQINEISFRIEEKTEAEMRIGVSMGYLYMRVVGDTRTDTKRFDAQYLSVFLRQPIRLSEKFSLHGSLSYRYNTGNDKSETDTADIDWSEVELQLGASLQFSNLRIMPFVSYNDTDGDISDDSGTDVFDLEDSVSQGLRFDYLVDPSAFVRFEILKGDRSGSFLTFARRY